MNWLQNNPVGKALLYVSGAWLLIAAVLAVAWSLPVSVDPVEVSLGETVDAAPVVAAREIATLNELEVINQRPVFNENRLPSVDEDIGDEALDATIEVKGAPDVKLTGVIITSEVKMATLTPSSGGKESVIAREGEGLIGDYVGWSVAEVKPRSVLLRSTDGQRLGLDLQVHDAAIKQPPKPAAPARPAQEDARAAVEEDAPPPVAGNDDQLSRAEQIRQRIAERREQLRLEQEARETQLQQERTDPGGSRARGGSDYQNAIRQMMSGARQKEENSDDNNG